jgi:thiol:disulfide interchange protein DsbD
VRAPRRGGWAAGAAGAVALALAGVAAAQLPGALQPKLLEAERAFSFSARPLDPGTIEARFAIADGYYLYRDKLKFTVEPTALAAAPVLPPGKVKHDQFFGNVETYRGALVVSVALPAPAPGARVTVKAESQGCADAGVCYPPQLQKVELDLPAAGAGPGKLVEASPPKKTWFK